MKPRSAMFDPNPCATSPIPDGTRIASRKTFRARRTAEIEHDFAQDKDAWSAPIELVKQAQKRVWTRSATTVAPILLVTQTVSARNTNKVLSTFKVKIPVKAGKRVPLIIGNQITSWAREVLRLPPSTAFRSAATLAQ